MAHAVNFVWNYCCQIDRQAYDRYMSGMTSKRPSEFDLVRLCTGAAPGLGIYSDTIAAVCRSFVIARDGVFPRTPRWRSSKNNLGWVPASRFGRCAKFGDGYMMFRGEKYKIWYDRSIPNGGEIKSGDFSQDAAGKWYVNVKVKFPDVAVLQGSSIGIDLGIKSFAVLSDGTHISNPNFYRATERRISIAQRRGQHGLVRKLHAKIKRQRAHFLHGQANRIVREHNTIYVGNVNPSALGKTKLAKSIYDAGWTTFRNMLIYKAIARGGVCLVVNEAYSSVTCSACHARSGPKGRKGLRIREWTCGECGSIHDRDINAARNILGAEHRPPAVEIAA